MLVLAGCGGGKDERLTVFAASSLTEVFEELAPQHRYNFAGSDELATQIREGAEADVYAAASPKYPAELQHEGFVGRPRVFATNTLVAIAPGGNPRDLERVGDLVSRGLRIVIGAEGVPVGDYTRDALKALGLTDVLKNVVSEEENVKGVLAKVALGEADAGFVYATDARAAGDRVHALALPTVEKTRVLYPIAVVAASDRSEAAEEFVALVLGPNGRRALTEAGFGLP
jgi:molybdate transport system substrate-binding protein